MAAELPPISYSTSTAEVIIEAAAARYGIAAQPLIDTLKCESNLVPSARGDHGTSWGVAQIHLPAHPEVSKEQALDPIWSIEWAAQQFAEGHAVLWSCFRRLYGNSSA